MKKLLSALLVLSVFAWGMVLADPVARLLIDIQSAVIVTPAGGDLKIGTGAGDLNGSVKVLSDGVEELTISPSAVTIPTNNLVVTAGNVTATAGDFVASTSGKTLKLQEAVGAAACMGSATLTAAADATVTTSCATTTSRIFLTRTSLDADTSGDMYVKTKNNGSFVLFSEANDTATVDWLIINEAP